MSSGTVLIVGATGGVGRALVAHLQQQGTPLALAARDEARLAALAEEVQGPYRVTDTNDWEAVEATFAWASELGESFAGAANVVGSLLLKPAHATEREAFQAVIDANLGSAFACVRAAGKLAAARRPRSLVLVSSAAASVGLANHEAIAAAKAGLEGLVRSAAATYAPHMRVNAVSPGLTRTPLTERLWKSERAAEASRAMHPLNAIGEPEQVASALAWFLHAQQSFVTGQVLAVDGGLASVRPRGR